VVKAIGFDPCPDAALVPVAPEIQTFGVVIAADAETKGDVAGVINALQMPRVREERYDGHHLLAALGRPRSSDVQSVDVPAVDGLQDLLELVPYQPKFAAVLFFDLSNDFIAHLSGFVLHVGDFLPLFLTMKNRKLQSFSKKVCNFFNLIVRNYGKGRQKDVIRK